MSLTVLGPALGIAGLAFLCGSGEVLRAIMAVSAHASVTSALAELSGGNLLQGLRSLLGPNPLVTLLAFAAIFTLCPADHGGFFLLIFSACTFALLLGIGGGAGRELHTIFDLPLRYLACFGLLRLTGLSQNYAVLLRTIAVLLICAVDLQPQIWT